MILRLQPVMLNLVGKWAKFVIRSWPPLHLKGFWSGTWTYQVSGYPLLLSPDGGLRGWEIDRHEKLYSSWAYQSVQCHQLWVSTALFHSFSNVSLSHILYTLKRMWLGHGGLPLCDPLITMLTIILCVLRTRCTAPYLYCSLVPMQAIPIFQCCVQHWKIGMAWERGYLYRAWNVMYRR